jgi:sigma-E factor negative regulatory protein RseB
VRGAVQEDTRQATRPGGSAVTSVAVLVLMLAPALVAITGAEVLPRGTAGAFAGAREGARAGTPAVSHQLAGAAAGRPAAAQSAGADVAAAGRVGLDQASGAGLRLLREAASAGETVSYRGVQIISWWSEAGSTTAVVNVTHESLRGTLLQTVSTGAEPAGESFMAERSGAHPGDVLGVTEQTLGLLAANYHVDSAGSGSACDRRADIVEARRDDGTLAARFWVDSETKIPLRRELFDHQARMVNENTFIDLTFGEPAGLIRLPRGGRAAPRPWKVLGDGDLARLRVKGWPLPDSLPGGLTLFDAWQTVMRSGPVFQLAYSDGLSGVSLFVQRGGLPRKLAGWNEITFSGRQVYVRGSAWSIGDGLTWSSDGHVFTVIADAPAATVSAAVGALPHDTQQGFWRRLRHGFGRLVSWLDPFG